MSVSTLTMPQRKCVWGLFEAFLLVLRNLKVMQIHLEWILTSSWILKTSSTLNPGPGATAINNTKLKKYLTTFLW